VFLLQIDKVLREYNHDQETYKKIRDLLNVEMNKGLSKKGNKDATVKMFVTYVQCLPDGTGISCSYAFFVSRIDSFSSLLAGIAQL